MQVLFNSKTYGVMLDRSELKYELVQLVSPAGLVTELLHPLDALRLGVHNGGYFNSIQSNLLHGHDVDMGSPSIVLEKYFSDREICKLPEHYFEPPTQQGLTEYNYFGVSASSSYETWLAKGWLRSNAPEGWFEAYTQHVKLGYSEHWPTEQKRMLSFVARHAGQLSANCAGDLAKRRKQRQALLNWASPLAFI